MAVLRTFRPRDLAQLHVQSKLHHRQERASRHCRRPPVRLRVSQLRNIQHGAAAAVRPPHLLHGLVRRILRGDVVDDGIQGLILAMEPRRVLRTGDIGRCQPMQPVWTLRPL